MRTIRSRAATAFAALLLTALAGCSSAPTDPGGAAANMAAPAPSAPKGALVLTLKQVDDTVAVNINGTPVFSRETLLRHNQPVVTVDLSDKIVRGVNGISVNAHNGPGPGTFEGNLTSDGKVVKEWKVIGDSRYHNGVFLSEHFSFDYTGTAPSGATTVNGCSIPVGWSKCRQIASPKITIYGIAAATDAAMDAVQKIYTDMTSRLAAPAKMDGVTVYLTNGRPWSEIGSLAPLGEFGRGIVEKGIAQGDDLRGGASRDFLWIDEQMICKKGVATRNEAKKAGLRSAADNDVRTFDQVVHEFGHTIANRSGLDGRLAATYPGRSDAVELWPWTIQNNFGTPAGTPAGGGQQLFDEVFTSTTTYTCDALYKP